MSTRKRRQKKRRERKQNLHIKKNINNKRRIKNDKEQNLHKNKKINKRKNKKKYRKNIPNRKKKKKEKKAKSNNLCNRQDFRDSVKKNVCYDTCRKAQNYDRQIKRWNKWHNIINNKKEKQKYAYTNSSSLVLKILERNCKELTNYRTLGNLNIISKTLSSCSEAISATCISPGLPEDILNNKICHREILNFKALSCDDSKCLNSNLTDNQWANFNKDKPQCKPKNTVGKKLQETLRNCKAELTRCKEAEKESLQFMDICPEIKEVLQEIISSRPPDITPGENKVTSTIVEENGEIVVQTETYNPDTEEVSIVVPRHGNYEEGTFIMISNSDVLMISTPDECRIGNIPHYDVDPHDIKTKEIESSDTTEPITAKKIYSSMVEGKTTSADDELLSPAMKKACANKTIKKTTQIKTSDETLLRLKPDELFTLKPTNSRRTHFRGCSFAFERCITRNDMCHYGKSILKLDLHIVISNKICINCCDKDDNTGQVCVCKDITTIKKLEDCATKGVGKEKCPDGFFTFCEVCRLDICGVIEPCNGKCPPNRKLCENKCYHDPIPARCKYKAIYEPNTCDGGCPPSTYLCKSRNKCFGERIPCPHFKKNALMKENPVLSCPEGRFLLNTTCLSNNQLHHYTVCNGHFVSKFRPCDDKCTEDLIICGNQCIYKNSTSQWKCQDSCQSQTQACGGNCTKGRVLCGNDTCIKESGENTNRTCGDKCITIRQPCNGTCLSGYTNCNNTCYEKAQIWNCNNVCQLKSKFCNGKCPDRYINCSGICRLEYHWKKCNGKCIYSRDSCVDTCQVGNITMKIGETLEYPEKCMIMICSLKNGSAVLESGTLGNFETGIEYAGCSCCSYDGQWFETSGNPMFNGTIKSTGCQSMTTASSRRHRLIKKEVMKNKK